MAYQQQQGGTSSFSGKGGIGGRQPPTMQRHTQQPTLSTSSSSPPSLRSDGKTVPATAGSVSSVASLSQTTSGPRYVDPTAAGGGARYPSGIGGSAAYGSSIPTHLPTRQYKAQQLRPPQQQPPPPPSSSSSLARGPGISVPPTAASSSLGSAHFASPPPPAPAAADLSAGPTSDVPMTSGAVPIGNSYAYWRGTGGTGVSTVQRRRSGSGRSGSGGGYTVSPGPRHPASQAQQLQHRPRGDLSATIPSAHTASSSALEAAPVKVTSASTNLQNTLGGPASSSWSSPQPPPMPSAAPGAAVSTGSGAPPVASHASQPSRKGGSSDAYSPRSSTATAPLSSALATASGSGGGGAVAGSSASSMPPALCPSGTATSTKTGDVSPPQKSQGAASGAAAPSFTTARLVRSNGEERPTVALSQNIMSVYEAINTLFYQERQLRLAAPAKYAAHPYEDSMGHYLPFPGEEIAERYVVREVIGKGSFGTVVHCIDLKYNESVAVKIIRSGPYFERQSMFEAQVVAHLNGDPELHNLVVQLRKVFLWMGHMVLVFEPLSFSLYRLITLTKHNGVSLDLTRKFAYQMIKVLLVLEQHQPPIIHCDLKPENVLLRDPSRSEVRVIDFGSAFYQQQSEWTPPPAQVVLPSTSPSRSPGPPWDTTADGARGVAQVTPATDEDGTSALQSPSKGAQQRHRMSGDMTNASVDSASASAVTERACADADMLEGADPAALAAAVGRRPEEENIIMPKYIQSRYYRSPEVILELGYTTAIDRWSLGCFLVEMHTGVPLFPGRNEGDMIAYFTSILGPLPDYMIAASPKRMQLYYTCPLDASSSGSSGGGGGGDGSAHGVVTTGGSSAVDAPPTFSPMSSAPGHAVGSPFFLRAPRPEGEGSVAAAGTGNGNDSAPSSLEEILGVYKGGPRGCRAGQPGHDEATYEIFCDFIHQLLQYDPRKRVSCQQAIQHPFLEPIRALKSRPIPFQSSAPGGVAEAVGPQPHDEAKQHERAPV